MSRSYDTTIEPGKNLLLISYLCQVIVFTKAYVPKKDRPTTIVVDAMSQAPSTTKDLQEDTEMQDQPRFHSRLRISRPMVFLASRHLFCVPLLRLPKSWANRLPFS